MDLKETGTSHSLSMSGGGFDSPQVRQYYLEQRDGLGYTFIMKTQYQHFWSAHRNHADGNNTFLELVKGGMTAVELKALIAKRPSLWGRFSNWVGKLP
jgi:hypothetical protein